MKSTRSVVELPSERRFPSLDGANAWINSPPLTPAALLGRVVVVDFCTYTCINWLRQLPYVRAWADRYKDQGLVVIGVHTPEFSFEKDLDNVRRALSGMRVEYPIAIDNDYAVWDAFANHYWPALYFIDAEGRIRHHRFGEGDYERSEIAIQQLLAEAGVDGISPDVVSVDARGPEAAADWNSLGSSERYLGYRQTQNFASPGGLTRDQRHVYARLKNLQLNHWSLTGDWTGGAESVVLNEPNGRIELSFRARDVHLVMGPLDRGTSVPFRVFIDGEPPRGASGSDVDEAGVGVLVDQRMYQLVRQEAPIGDRVFAVEFQDRAAEAFAFTFG